MRAMLLIFAISTKRQGRKIGEDAEMRHDVTSILEVG